MEGQIYGKKYRVILKANDAFDDYRLVSFRSVIIYDNGLLFDQGHDLDPHSLNLFYSVEHYKKQYGSNFVGLEFQSEEFTTPMQIITALLKDNLYRQQPILLSDILEKISDLFVLFTDLI